MAASNRGAAALWGLPTIGPTLAAPPSPRPLPSPPSLFHLHLNVLGELTRFGDREFYRDWWNASTVGDYWRTWNMPVHKFLLRTVYFPAMRAGVSRCACGAACVWGGGAGVAQARSSVDTGLLGAGCAHQCATRSSTQTRVVAARAPPRTSHRCVPRRYWSTVLVFFVSAVFHELAIGVPLHMVRCWAFAGIMLQVRA